MEWAGPSCPPPASPAVRRMEGPFTDTRAMTDQLAEAEKTKKLMLTLLALAHHLLSPRGNVIHFLLLSLTVSSHSLTHSLTHVTHSLTHAGHFFHPLHVYD
jgi:hypothetical protein